MALSRGLNRGEGRNVFQSYSGWVKIRQRAGSVPGQDWSSLEVGTLHGHEYQYSSSEDTANTYTQASMHTIPPICNCDSSIVEEALELRIGFRAIVRYILDIGRGRNPRSSCCLIVSEFGMPCGNLKLRTGTLTHGMKSPLTSRMRPHTQFKKPWYYGGMPHRTPRRSKITSEALCDRI